MRSTQDSPRLTAAAGSRLWWYAPWKLTNPLWPLVWRGGDEYDRATLVIQPPLLGAFVFAYGRPSQGTVRGPR